MGKVFNDDFLNDPPESTDQAILSICGKFNIFDESMEEWPEKLDAYEEYVKATGILNAYLESKGIDFGRVQLETGEKYQDIDRIIAFFRSWKNKISQVLTEKTLEDYTEKYRRKFGKAFHYTFSDGDLKRVQTLLNETREILMDADWLEEGHKSRLLRRLEKLQSELHKSVSDVDRFWGFFIDASIVAKRVGENAKPLVDRFGEIMQIVWGIQARAGELSSNEPLQLDLKDDE